MQVYNWEMHEQTFRGGCYLFTDKVTKFQRVKAMSGVREIVGDKASKLKKNTLKCDSMVLGQQLIF